MDSSLDFMASSYFKEELAIFVCVEHSTVSGGSLSVSVSSYLVYSV